MVSLSKSKLISYRQCPKRLWLQTYRQDLLPDVDIATQARFDEGNRVGDVARQIYKGGVHIKTLNREEALIQTNEVLGKKQTIYEAAFYEQDVLIRADVLVPDHDHYRIIEVKSSTSVKDYHIEDAAIQAWVMKQAGINPSRISVAYINNKFIYMGDGDYTSLLIEEDITSKAQARIDDAQNWVSTSKTTLESTHEPNIEPGERCNDPFPCEFQYYCSPADPDVQHPIHILPNAKKLIAQLTAGGYSDLTKVPLELLDHSKHIRMHQSIIINNSTLDPEASNELKSLAYPRYYLDFETIAFAVPIWKGTHPYLQIPFQWSCHVEKENGELTHYEFLDISGNDPRYEFSKSLIEVLGSVGPIIVYSASFEGARIKELAKEYPELGDRLLKLVDRFFDLLPLARNNYYHPDMKGSWSIKAILPTIDSELDYANLVVSDGAQAQQAYREAIDPTRSSESRIEIRKEMLKYCAQDTLAMVKIVQAWEK